MHSYCNFYSILVGAYESFEVKSQMGHVENRLENCQFSPILLLVLLQ